MAELDSQLRQRVERFKLLRGAQRAMARCMHPAALEELREDARQLLIRLQAAMRSDGDAAGAASLGEIEALLTHHLGRTLELLGKLEFAQLRAAGPELRREKPDELRALVDVILLGDLSDDQAIRRVEYLITMLCAEDEAGRRSQVEDPSALTPGLQKIARRKLADASIEADVAVARLEVAAQSLIREGGQLDRRDEIRAFKQELGASLLHPRILVAAVAYNVAMANQVSARIDGSLALDHLADDLLAELEQPAVGDSTVLHGSGMAQLAAALRARVRGDSSEDAAASRIVAELRIDGLVPREIEALEDPDADPLNPLIVNAIVLGCLLRQQSLPPKWLAKVGLEPAQLERDALPALEREIADVSSKLFSDGGYPEAFELSEVKTRNLSAVHAAVERKVRRSAEPAPEPSAAATVDVAGRRLPFGLSPAMAGLIVVGPLLGLLIGVGLFSLLGTSVRTLSESELGEISPFLDTGHEREEDGELRFVGHLFPTWGYLATPEREQVAIEVATHFLQRGVRDGVLLGVGPREMVRWDDGVIVELVPKPDDQP